MDKEQDALLSNTDDESNNGTENECLPLNTSTNKEISILTFDSHKEFILYKFLLLLSSIFILVLLPLYVDRVNVSGDVYSLISTSTILSTFIFTVIAVALKFLHSKYREIAIFKITIKLSKLVQLSVVYFLSAILITYALDRKRVVCHIQDPLKGLVIVLSFLYHFFFSERLLCLKRIFSVVAIIIGLFITLDYSMSNEFKCRGYERQLVSDDKGEWTQQAHTIWTLIYIAGLALYAAFCTVLECIFANISAEFTEENNPSTSVNDVPYSVPLSNPSGQNINEEPPLRQKVNAIHLALWMHVFGIIIVLLLFASNFVPQIGKGYNGSEVLNYTGNGILCHFSNKAFCNNLPTVSWLFLFVYIVFVISSIQFLILTQSAIYTIATIAAALPMVQIWWSLFSTQPIAKGIIIWNPSFSGDLVSPLIGLPIVVVGLFFLNKHHRKNCCDSHLPSI